MSTDGEGAVSDRAVRDEARADQDEARARKDEAREARAGAREEAKAEGSKDWHHFLGSVSRWAATGTGVGTANSIPLMYLDKTGAAAAMSFVGFTLVGIYGAFLSQRTAARKADGLADVEVSLARSKAEEGTEREARKAADLRLAACQAENAELRTTFVDFEKQIKDLSTRVESERVRGDKLMENVIDLANRLSALDRRPG